MNLFISCSVLLWTTRESSADSVGETYLHHVPVAAIARHAAASVTRSSSWREGPRRSLRALECGLESSSETPTPPAFGLGFCVGTDAERHTNTRNQLQSGIGGVEFEGSELQSMDSSSGGRSADSLTLIMVLLSTSGQQVVRVRPLESACDYATDIQLMRMILLHCKSKRLTKNVLT